MYEKLKTEERNIPTYLYILKLINHLALDLALSLTRALKSSKASKIRDEVWREEGTNWSL